MLSRTLEFRSEVFLLFGIAGLMVGPVLDVVCMKAGGMRGQAHVVFRDVVTATTAMRALQNFMFLDKEMVCNPNPALRAPDLPFFVGCGLT